MRYLVLLAILLGYCSRAPAVELIDGKVKLEEDEKVSLSNCKAEGGCSILTQKEMLAILKYYVEKAYVAGTQTCNRKSL